MCPPPKPQRPYHRRTPNALSLHSVFAWLFSTALICLTHETNQHHSSLSLARATLPFLGCLPRLLLAPSPDSWDTQTYAHTTSPRIPRLPPYLITKSSKDGGKGEKQEIGKVDPIACCTAEPSIEPSRRQSPRSVAPARARFLAISRHLSPRREQDLCATLQGGLRIEHSLQSCGWSASLRPLTIVISSTNV